MESWMHGCGDGNLKTTLEPVWRSTEIPRTSVSLPLCVWLISDKFYLLSALKAVAMVKIVNSKELPVIPNYLSDECKDFIRQCLQWNPLQRPTAAQLLEHPFLMESGVSPGNQVLNSTLSDHIAVTSAVISLVCLPIFCPIIIVIKKIWVLSACWEFIQ